MSPKPAGASSPFFSGDFVEIASGLGYPEGPVYYRDGSVTVLEVKSGNITRLSPSGNGYSATVVATIAGGAPNGSAIGPDGALYVCDNGGMTFHTVQFPNYTLDVPLGTPPSYRGGRIVRVMSGAEPVETYCATNSIASSLNPLGPDPHGLRGPDDIVFDSSGGFWFTDWGKVTNNGRSRDVTGIYYVAAGSQQPVEMIPGRGAPNGIALRPGVNGQPDRLYVAETYSRWTHYWELDGPGKIRANPSSQDGSYLHCAAFPQQSTLDSMALDEEGNLYVVCILPQGLNAMAPGGIAVVSPAGVVVDFVTINVGPPDPLPSNICFGGPDRKTAFITLGGTGRVVTCAMNIAGQELAYAS